MLPRESKQLLANIIRHTDTHNRILEEEECWKQRSLQLRKQTRRPSYSLAPLESRPERSYGSEDIRMNSRAHMDCESDVRQCSYEGREEKTSTFWLRQYDRAEMEDSERWGHNGYKELYPQDFVSDSNDDDDRGNKNVDGFICSKRCHSPDLEVKKKHKRSRQAKEGRKSKKRSHRHKNTMLEDSKPHKSKRHKSSKLQSHKGKKKHKKHKD